MIKSREKKLLIGTLMLTFFGFVGKLLGAVFKIGLTTIVGSYGIGLYQLLFPVLVFFIVFSSEGFSTALTVRQAECQEKGGAYFSLSLIGSLSVSILSFFLIVLISIYFSRIQGVKLDSRLYLIVGVGVCIVSLLSINKARIRGMERYVAYSLFETLEDVLKVFFALILAWGLKPFGLTWSVAGVFIGVLLSSFITLIATCFYKPQNHVVKQLKLTREEKRSFYKYSLLSMAAVIVIPAVQFIESAIVVGLLTGASMTSVTATKLYGISRGAVSAIINLPFFLISSVEVVLLPNLSRSKENGIYFKKTQLCLFFAVALSIPFVFAFELFSHEFIQILYSSSLTKNEMVIASNLLRIGAIGILFASVSSFLMIILNSNNRTIAPFIANLLAGVAKIIFIIFMSHKLSIYAVEFASVLFSMITCLINLIFAKKYGVIKVPKFVLPVIVFWAIFFILIKVVYCLLQIVITSNILALICAGLIVLIAASIIAVIVWVLLRKLKKHMLIKG